MISDSDLQSKDILSENKKLKKEILVLKSKSNNFIKLYFKYKEISEKLNTENKQLTKERDEYKKKKAELNNEIEIIKINNDRMNNIKIKNNILINSNLTIKNRMGSNSKEKNNKKENNNIKKIEIMHKKDKNELKNIDYNITRNKSAKNKVRLHKNKFKDLPIYNTNNKNNLNNTNNFNVCKEIEINLIGKKIQNINDNKNNNQINNNINNNNNYNENDNYDKNKLEQDNKNKMVIIERLNTEIQKLKQCITKYQLEIQIAEKNKKNISDSNAYQINGLNELIKLLKEKNRKLNIENENLRNKTDERIIELVKELNIKENEMSSFIGKINILKKELNNNGINIPNID